MDRVVGWIKKLIVLSYNLNKWFCPREKEIRVGREKAHIGHSSEGG